MAKDVTAREIATLGKDLVRFSFPVPVDGDALGLPEVGCAVLDAAYAALDAVGFRVHRLNLGEYRPAEESCEVEAVVYEDFHPMLPVRQRSYFDGAGYREALDKYARLCAALIPDENGEITYRLVGEGKHKEWRVNERHKPYPEWPAPRAE